MQSGMKKTERVNLLNQFLIKMFACLFILICLALGVVGLILPIIPGLLFIAIAGMIAATYFPVVDSWLRKSKTMSSYLDSSKGFVHLSFWSKAQYCGWLCLKIFIDSIVLIFAMVLKILSFRPNKISS